MYIVFPTFPPALSLVIFFLFLLLVVTNVFWFLIDGLGERKEARKVNKSVLFNDFFYVILFESLTSFVMILSLSKTLNLMHQICEYKF